jgi:hypothetical protein
MSEVYRAYSHYRNYSSDGLKPWRGRNQLHRICVPITHRQDKNIWRELSNGKGAHYDKSPVVPFSAALREDGLEIIIKKVEMNKEIIEEYQRMKKERDALYVRTLNLNIGSGLRMLKDELYVKEANLKKYMWLHNLTDDFTHDL